MTEDFDFASLKQHLQVERAGDAPLTREQIRVRGELLPTMTHEQKLAHKKKIRAAKKREAREQTRWQGIPADRRCPCCDKIVLKRRGWVVLPVTQQAMCLSCHRI